MMRSSLLLLACLALALMAAGEADADKEPKWSYSVSDSNDYGFGGATISADGETMAVTYLNLNGTSNLLIFNSYSNHSLWNHYIDGEADWVEISDDGLYIIVSTSHGYYDAGSNHTYFFDIEGNLLWDSETNWSGVGENSLTISENGECAALVGYGEKWKGGEVVFFETGNGTVKWNYSFETRARDAVLSSDGSHLLFTTDPDYDEDGISEINGTVYLFNRDGEMLWNYTDEPYIHAIDMSDDAENIIISKNYGSERSDVILLDGDGSIVWSYQVDNWVESLKLTSDGEKVALGIRSTGVNEVRILDGDGIFLWNYTFGRADWVEYTYISDDGKYVVVSVGGGHAEYNRTYVFDSAGTELWNHTFGNVVRSQWIDVSSSGEYIVLFETFNKFYLFETDSLPQAFLEGNMTSPVALKNTNVSFKGYGRDDISEVIEYEWKSNIDGVLSPLSSFTTDSLSLGEHTISFRVRDSSGAWSENVTISVIIHSIPRAYINSVSPNPSDEGEVITFSGYGYDEYSIVEYKWVSNLDGVLSNETEFDSYLSVGVHNVSFSVKDNFDVWSASQSIDVTVLNILPVAVIDYIGPNPNSQDSLVTFRGSFNYSNGQIMGYEWISDLYGTISNERNFSTNTLPAGTHNIFFFVLDDEWYWSAEASKTLRINARPSAVIDSVNPSPTERNHTVNFQGHGNDWDGEIVSYKWASSIDGELSIKSNFSIDSLSLGTHSISFVVTDNEGLQGWDSYYYLWVYNSPKAIANYWNDQNEIGPGMETMFTGTGSDEDGTIVLYEWDFNGDGEFDWSGSNGETSYTYMNLGIYNAVLRVTDNDGFTATDSRVIIVSEDDEDTPTLSVITAMAAVAVMALRRRPE